TSTNGQVVLQKIVENNKLSVAEIVDQLDLKQVDDSQEIIQLAREIIAQYPEQVAAYRAGKLALLQFFIGQIMRRSKGKANPELAREILEKELKN
ncbi:MAG TPA: Asp-tRNA(Asn)/Glu-tRNA(Gln) amidotransferase GatCAB subunit B, partial [bacterium]|nr:Asp-tRNA(Asn)/Glu-tRNA(Gln) amidotransferase GatCAB subunit B [bacterium]